MTRWMSRFEQGESDQDLVHPWHDAAAGRRRRPLGGRPSFCRLIATSGVLVTLACSDGTLTHPTAPSEGTTSAAAAGTETAGTGVTDLARDGGRVDAEMSGSEWTGTCTVTRSGTRGRAKALGTGPPNTVVVFWLDANGIGAPTGVVTNRRGTFRTGWISRTLRASDELRCELRSHTGTVWATSDPFTAP